MSSLKPVPGWARNTAHVTFLGRDSVVEFLTAFWDAQTDQRRHIFTNVVVSDLTGTSQSVELSLSGRRGA